jgi:hypothetical protein
VDYGTNYDTYYYYADAVTTMETACTDAGGSFQVGC